MTETNFPHKLLLTNTQVSKICEAFASGLSANIKFSKTQLSKVVQFGGFMPVPSILGPPILLRTSSIMDPILNLFLKEEDKNASTKNRT